MARIKLVSSIIALSLAAAACGNLPDQLKDASKEPVASLPAAPVMAAGQSAPVGTLDDAADDPAIWVHKDAPEKSLILGTDKKAGLYAYDLSGAVVSFDPAGKVNNVDLRQGVTLKDWSGDLAAASNRSDDTVTFFAVSENGAHKIGAVPSSSPTPYGFCMGLVEGVPHGFVAHKTGELAMMRFEALDAAPLAASHAFASQLEGCVHDDAASVLYVGEEETGIWRMETKGGTLSAPTQVDVVGGPSGLTADVEGLTLYTTGEGTGYLIASSQGDNSYVVYSREGDNAFLGRFRIVKGGGDGALIDGTQETDGITVSSAALGPDYPKGLFVAQDGINGDKAAANAQNFKFVDWRSIETALSLD